jgi:hypothetical protein
LPWFDALASGGAECNGQNRKTKEKMFGFHFALFLSSDSISCSYCFLVALP